MRTLLLLRQPVKFPRFGTFKFLIIACLFTGITKAHSAENLAPLPGEEAMMSIIQNHPDQGRPSMIHNEVLQFVARRKAEDMAQGGEFAHVDEEGFAVNFIADQAGYHHPYSLAPTANSMESIGVQHQNNITPAVAAQIVFDAWMESPLHKSHVLAENAGFQEQTYFAVGYAYTASGPFDFNSHYFVFVSAPPDEGVTFGSYAEWRFDNLTLTQMSDPEDDTDQDGIPNPFEYALETDPLQRNAFPSPTVQLEPSTGEFRIAYPFRENLDLSLQFSMLGSDGQGSGGFWNWQPVPFTQEGNKFLLSTTSAPKGFYQLQVERQ